MIALLLSVVPVLLWEQPAATAPDLKKAGIHQIAVSRDAASWASTGITATEVDPTKMTKLDTIGVDYKMDVSGATAAPWVNSNLWQMMRNRESSFLYEIEPEHLPLAVAEAYAGNVKTFFRVKPEGLDRFVAACRFFEQLGDPGLQRRVNFSLFDDGSKEMEEIMNLLVRRNLLFDTARDAGTSTGMQVRIGTPEYPAKSAEDPYLFGAMVRSKIGDDKRIVRIYGADTVLAQVFANEKKARVILLQYGNRVPQDVRVRMLGVYPHVRASVFGRDGDQVTDVSNDDAATEFTIPRLTTFAVVDLDAKP